MEFMVLNLCNSFVVDRRLTKRDVQGVPFLRLGSTTSKTGNIVNHRGHGLQPQKISLSRQVLKNGTPVGVPFVI